MSWPFENMCVKIKYAKVSQKSTIFEKKQIK